MGRYIRLLSLIVVMSTLLSLAACGQNVPENSVFSSEDLYGKNIGVCADTAAVTIFGQEVPAGATISVYASVSDMVAALGAGLVDCVITDYEYAQEAVTRKLKIIDEPYYEREFSIMVALENSDLKDVVDLAIAELRADGTIESITDFYMNSEGEGYMPSDTEYSAVLTLGVISDFPPYSYYDEGANLIGIDIDVARAVCDYIGVGLEVQEVTSDEMVSLVQSGQIDMGMSGSCETAENTGRVLFTEAYITCTQVIMVRKK